MAPDENQKPADPGLPTTPSSKPFNPGPPPPPPSPGSTVGPGGTDLVPPPPPPPSRPMPAFMQPNQPTVGMVTPSRPKKKKLAALVVALLLVVGGSAGAYYAAVILPNQPENVWAKALSNTGKGYDKLVDYADENKDAKAFKANGSFKFDSDVVVDGTFDVRGKDSNAELTLDVGAAGTRYGFDARLIKPASSNYPDTYFRVSGLKGLGELLSGGEPAPSVIKKAIKDLDNQWIVVDHSIFNQLEKELGADTTDVTELTSADFIAMARKVGEANDQYLFTDDSSKAVLTLAQKMGKEDKDGKESYHFKVGYNKEHLKAYVTAVKDGLKETKLVDLVPDKDLEKAVDFKGLLESIDKMDGKGQADVWVDMHTKLIRAVRFTDSEHTDSFMELGLDYNGGDEFPFTMKFEGGSADPSSGLIAITLKPKTKTTTFKVTADAEQGEGVEAFSFNLDATSQLTDQVDEIQKPAGAKSWTEIIGPLLGPLFGGAAPSRQGPPSLDMLPTQL